MYLDDRTLLPSDTQVPGAQDIYIIEEFLGLGLTAQVYRARQVESERIVALKVLRHDAGDVSREHFWHEALVLNEIRFAGITNVPEVYEQQKTGEIQFLAMEYMDRAVYQPLDERLEPLPELEALEAAHQALTMLQALHEQVGRTYTDMQLKNFYWDAAGQTLKILDWNHVSTLREYIQPDELRGFGIEIPDEPTKDERDAAFAALAQRDLARFGAYFYRMLMGKGALEQGETTYALAQRAGERWERISVAARQIARRALHPDPLRRYPTASDFLADVTALQERWGAELDEEAERQALDDLLEAAKDATVERPEARRKLDEVDARLDLLERRGVDLLGYRRRLEKMTRGVSAAWGSGWLYYQAEQYAEAARIWELEALAQGLAGLWRWVMLAQSGVAKREVFEPAREPLEQVVKTLEERDFASAAQTWDTLKAAQPWVVQEEVPARFLGVEIAVAQQAQAGRAAELEGDTKQSPEAWDKAATAYEQAVKHLETIPYADLLRGEYGWEALETWGETLRLKSKTCRAANVKAQELRKQLETDFELGRVQVQAVLSKTPGATEVLALCETCARERQASDPAQALELLDTALLYGHTTDPAWIELRQDLQIVVRRRKLADVGLRQIEALLAEGNWGKLQQVAQSLRPETRSDPRYAGLVVQVEQAYQTRLDSGDLEAAQQLDAALTLLDKSSAERARELQELERQLLREELEGKAAQIETAVQTGDWATLRQLAAALPVEMRTEPRYAEMVAYIEAAYQQHLEEQSLWVARQLHEALTLLGDESETRSQELENLEQQLQAHSKDVEKRVEELEGKESTLREQIVKEERQRAEAEQARKNDEARDKKLRGFREWAGKQHTHWQSLESERGAAAYPDILQEVESNLLLLSERYEDLAGAEIYRGWKDYLDKRKPKLEQQIEEAKQSQERLDEAKQQLDEAVHQAGLLTVESLAKAQTAHQQAAAKLKYHPPGQHKERYTQLQAQAVIFGQLFQVMTQKNIIPAVRDAENCVEKLQTQLSQQTDEKDLLKTLGRLSAAWRWVENGFGKELLPQAKKYFPTLALLDQRRSEWVKFAPFSRSGQSTKIILVPSVDSSIFENALTTAQGNITTHINTSLEPLQPLPERVTQLEEQTRGAPRWVSLALSGVALALGVVLLVLFLVQMRQDRQVQQEIAAWGALVTTATPTQVAEAPSTPIPTVEAVVQATEMPATTEAPTESPTPTPTATATPTPTPLPPFTGVTLDWTRGITLYDMPPLTLTAASGWVLTLTTPLSDTTPITYLQAIDSQGDAWTVNVRVTDTVSQTEQVGVFTWITDTVVIWNPDPAGEPLRSGRHEMGLLIKGLNDVYSNPEPQPLDITLPLRVTVLVKTVRTTPNISGSDIYAIVVVGTELDVTGKMPASGNSSITLLQVRLPGADEVLWVPTGRNGALEGPDVYVKPMGRWTLTSILPLIPDVTIPEEE